MKGEPLARLVESSEADAYGELLRVGRSCSEDFVTKSLGGAVVIVSPSVTTSLNLNRAIGVGVFEPATPELIDSIAAEYGTRNLSYGIEIGPFARPAELPEWLRLRGMRRGIATAMLVRELDVATERAPMPVDVHEAEGTEVDLVAEICCEVFRMPEACRRLLTSVRTAEHWRHWLALVGGRPAGAAMSFAGEPAAWLGWDATLPSYRGMGVHTSLIRRRLQDARRRGCQFATAETGVGSPSRRDPSLRNYETEGFTVAYHRHTHIGLASRPTAGPSKGD